MPTPDERTRLAELLPAYLAALAPASLDVIEEEIGMLALAYPAAKISAAEADARLEMYVRDLAELPADILRSACAKARRECRFFPSINEIMDRADGFAQRKFRAWRVQHLIAKHDAEYRAPEPEQPLSADEQAELERILRKYAA